MDNQYVKLVRDFHKTMNCAYGMGTKNLRIALITEEAGEVKEAITAEDPVLLLDGLCDLLYVSYGTADILGIDLHVVAGEIELVENPPLGFEHIKEQSSQIDIVLSLVTEALRLELEDLITPRLRDIINGCWVTSKRGLGLDLEPFFLEVHRTNMLKLEGPIREDGKRLKPPGWIPPRIAEMYAKRKGMPVTDDIP